MKVPVPLILASQTPQTSHFILSKACSKSCWYTVDERVLAFTEQILNFSIQNELLLPRLTASGRRILVHVQIQSSFSVQSLLSSLPPLFPSSFLPSFLPSNSHTDSSTQPPRLSSATQAHTHTSFDTSPPHSEDQRPILRWIEKRVRGKPRDNRAERGLPARNEEMTATRMTKY